MGCDTFASLAPARALLGEHLPAGMLAAKDDAHGAQEAGQSVVGGDQAEGDAQQDAGQAAGDDARQEMPIVPAMLRLDHECCHCILTSVLAPCHSSSSL